MHGGCQAMQGNKPIFHGITTKGPLETLITLGHDATQSFGQIRNVAVHVKIIVMLTCSYLPLTPPTTASTSRRCLQLHVARILPD